MTMLNSSDNKIDDAIRNTVDYIKDIEDTPQIEYTPTGRIKKPRKTSVLKKDIVESKTSAKRFNTVSILNFAINGLTTFLSAKLPENISIQVYKFQAPAIAYLIDSKIQNTSIDKKILQPLSKFTGNQDFAILALPGLLEAYLSNPENDFLEGQINYLYNKTLLLNYRSKLVSTKIEPEDESDFEEALKAEGKDKDFNFAKSFKEGLQSNNE